MGVPSLDLYGTYLSVPKTSRHLLQVAHQEVFGVLVQLSGRRKIPWRHVSTEKGKQGPNKGRIKNTPNPLLLRAHIKAIAKRASLKLGNTSCGVAVAMFRPTKTRPVWTNVVSSTPAWLE